MLLEDIVNEDLKEDQENNEDKVALLQQEAALRSTQGLTPHHADDPASTPTSDTANARWHDAQAAPFPPVDVLLRLLYRFNGTLKFAEVGSFFPQTVVVFAFVSCDKSGHFRVKWELNNPRMF